MERKIGEIFEFGGDWYQCIEDTTDDNCNNCCLQKSCPIISGDCASETRSDGKSVAFKKLEKVGEPYRRWLSPSNNIMVQRYRLYGRNVIMPDEPIMLLEPNYKNSVEIEIKQNQLEKNMEEQHSTENYSTKEEKIAERIANKVSEDIQNQLEKNMEEKGHYIGEIWESNGWYYKCVPQEDEKMRCQGCVFAECGSEHCEEWHGGCSKEKRTDGKNVIFKRLKEVWKNTYWGDPKWCDKNVYETFEDAREAGRAQGDRYITSENIANEYGHVERDVKCNDKKDKDMEEKKLNLKPFDIQKAREGKPVCTRDGRKARIICFDIKDKDNPIAAAVYVGECESVYLFTNKGEYNKGREDELDLMMLPEKKEGWVNIVRGSDGKSHMGRGIFQSKEEAKDAIKAFSDNLIDTVKICWEE